MAYVIYSVNSDYFGLTNKRYCWLW